MEEARETLKRGTMMSIARAVSHLGTCKRAKVGCVIVKDGRIIATGYNGSPPGFPHCIDVGCVISSGHCMRTIHAEANAICFAAKNGIATNGATIYVYGGRPICIGCDKLLTSAGILKRYEECEDTQKAI